MKTIPTHNVIFFHPKQLMSVCLKPDGARRPLRPPKKQQNFFEFLEGSKAKKSPLSSETDVSGLAVDNLV